LTERPHLYQFWPGASHGVLTLQFQIVEDCLGGRACDDVAVNVAVSADCTERQERDDQIAHRRKKPGRPIDFGAKQKDIYRGRNVVGPIAQRGEPA
jgi:hypothetical protein